MSFRRSKALERRSKIASATAAPSGVMTAPRPAPSAPKPQAVARAATPPENPMAKFGAYLLGLFLFVYFSRIFDVLSHLTGNLHIPMVLITLVLLFAIGAGGLAEAWRSPIGLLETGFVTWVGLATVFSSWRAASYPIFLGCLHSAAVFLAIMGLVRNLALLERVARAIALAGLFGAIFSFIFSRDLNGRTAVDIGTLADPNEYALILLMTLPYWWLAARNSRTPKLMTIVASLAAIPMLIAFFRAGSRAGLLALIGLILAILYRARPQQRIAFAIAVVMVAGVAAVALPQNLRERYVTWFSSTSDPSLQSDVDSANGRWYYLIQSIKVTLQHPLLGVGPGEFGDVNWELSRAAGRHIMPQPTHNTYTEASSETGIPGLLFFLAMLIVSLRSTLRLAKLARAQPGLKRLSTAAECIFVSITAFAVGAFFLSLSYNALMTVAFGLAAALRNIARNEFGLHLNDRTRDRLAIMPR